MKKIIPINKHIILIITIIIGLSLVIGHASAANTKTVTHKTVNKQTSIYIWQITKSYYQNKYIKISMSKTYVNGYVWGTNPSNGKYERAPVYARQVKISPLNKNVKITKIVTTSTGWPSGKLYYNLYTNKSNKWIAPGKYKGFWKFTISYTVKT